MSAIPHKDKVFYLREQSMAAVNKIVRCTKNTSISYTISSCIYFYFGLINLSSRRHEMQKKRTLGEILEIYLNELT